MPAIYEYLYVNQLCQLIDSYFDLKELEILYFKLGVKYDHLEGEDKTADVGDLVSVMDWQMRLGELIALCRQERPTVNWEEVLTRGGEGHKKRDKDETREPELVEIPAGEFWMGSENGRNDEKPLHQLYLDTFWIAQTPVTNAQYRLYVEETGARQPRNWWQDNGIPPGLEEHPVILINWYDTLRYCRWLSLKIGKNVTLPSEAEWEKAARGDKDQREYPWGDTFDAKRANTEEAGIGTTSRVGSYPDGVSPYGVLDMSGNVWEWTRTLWGVNWQEADFSYPYVIKDGREDLDGRGWRILRGGSCYNEKAWASCCARNWHDPHYTLYDGFGFRVAISPFDSER